MDIQKMNDIIPIKLCCFSTHLTIDFVILGLSLLSLCHPDLSQSMTFLLQFICCLSHGLRLEFHLQKLGMINLVLAFLSLVYYICQILWLIYCSSNLAINMNLCLHYSHQHFSEHFQHQLFCIDFHHNRQILIFSNLLAVFKIYFEFLQLIFRHTHYLLCISSFLCLILDLMIAMT